MQLTKTTDDVPLAKNELEQSPYLLPNGQIDWDTALSDNERWMRSTIAQRVGETSAVDEVFQDVALAATRQKSPIRDVSKIGAWLYRLVVVQSSLYKRTLGRKRKLLQRCEENAEAVVRNNAQDDPLDWLLDKERKDLVRKALNQLDHDERKILLLKYAEDKSYQEIADVLQTTVSAVQSKLHRARIRLKKCLHTFISDNN